MKEDTIRCFIALYPDPPAQAHIADFIQCLKEKSVPVRLEKASQVHITVRFLGDVTGATIDHIHEQLRLRLARQSGFAALMDRVGMFPNNRSPRVIWLGFSDAPVQMTDVFRVVDRVCGEAGIPPEKKGLTPHLTIARVKDPARARHWKRKCCPVAFKPFLCDSRRSV